MRPLKERIESIVEAGKTRMRPILITALTTVLGLVVMALGIGTGQVVELGRRDKLIGQPQMRAS